jgi:hypothetical protein
MTEISDEKLKFLILGWLRGGLGLDAFPIYLHEDRPFREIYDEDGEVEAFEMITRSGLIFQVSVTFVGELDANE